MDINRIYELAQSIWTDYKTQANGTMRWLQDYRKEVQTYKDYRGREILELLQNADDAQSESVKINIDTVHRTLSIINSGSRTIPFTEEGIQSIMLSNLSPKKGNKLIGSKGLGFRSVLNWSNRIEIRSDNISLRFGNDIVKEKWKGLKKRISEANKFEKEANSDGRDVPLAILALPEISPLGNPTQESTSVILSYELEYEGGILNDLEKFQPESLLFLHNVRHIIIVIDGQIKEYEKSCVKPNNGSFIEVELNGNHWIQSYESGILNDTDKEYEVSCAFCLNQPHESYKIFSYFPTQTDFPFPCILHASLELDSSRNSLVSNDENNKTMMHKLAGQIAKVSTYLKQSGRHDWYPYMLMRPDASKQQNEYVNLLIKSVNDLSADGEFIPTVDGGFTDEDGYYYYSDGFYEQTNNSIGIEVFSKQRLINAPVYARLNRLDPDMKQHIEEYSEKLSGNINAMAEYIKALLTFCEGYFISGIKFNILPDPTGNMIEGTAYVNTGMEIEEIPDFRQIKYVNSGLVSELKKNLGLGGKEPDRDLVSRLKSITDVSATDVSAVTRNLLPKAADKSLDFSQKQALIKCIFKLFLKRGKLLEMNDDDLSRPTAYLFSESGCWLPANEMVLVDKKFPNGFDRLGINYSYKKDDCVQYPEYLSDIEGADPESIQQFYLSLGVQLYFKRELLNYGDDSEYIHALSLPALVSSNCGSSRLAGNGKNENATLVGSPEFFKQLSLQDILKVIQVSDYYECVCGGQQIAWFKSKRQNEQVGLSYAAFKLQQLDNVKQLQYYIIDDDSWLAGFEPSPVLHFDRNDYREKVLLEALGAKKSMKDFTVNELYNAINNMEYSFDGSTVGIAENYHSIIQALDAKGAAVESLKNKTLRMLCRVKGQLEFRNSTEIYYSDNNELPNELIKELPMLVMGRREGEQKIKRIVGCKTLKDIQVIIRQKCLNENLTKDLNRRIETRKPYILAFASLGVRTRGGSTSVSYNENAKNLLTSFMISVVNDIDYQYSVEDGTLFTDEEKLIDDGELLCVDKDFYICSCNETLEEAMENPRFKESVIEAICIRLNLSGNDVADRFYRIFDSSENDLKYYQKQEIASDLWNECKGLFGMTDDDIAFWTKVYEINNCTFEKEQLREKKSAYLIETLKIDPNRLASPDRFCEYHFQKLKECRQVYKMGYLDFVYQQIESDRTLHKEYIQRQTPFVRDEWLRNVLEKNDNKYHITIDYDKLLRNEMKSVFGYIPDAKNVIEHAKRRDYLDGIDEFSLSDEEKSLLFFNGYEEYFNGLREKQNKEKNTLSQSDEEHINEIQIKEYTMSDQAIPEISSQKKQSGQKRRGNKKISDQRRIRLGYEAEDKVYDALTRSDKYKIIEVYSSHLSKTGAGDDSKGYDLEYKKEGDDIPRCLEIKHYDGNSIILTENEYKVSQSKECSGRYDLALVTDNEVRIIRDAFVDKSKFKKEVNDYTVYFTVNDK